MSETSREKWSSRKTGRKTPAASGPGAWVPRFLRGLAISLMLILPSGAALAAGGGSSGGAGEMDRMIAVTPMPITIIQHAKVVGILMVEFYIEASNPADAGRIQQLMPRLMDAYRTGLNEFAANEVRLDRPVNLDRLELYLNRGTREVIGGKGARIIYKQIMVQRR